VPVIEVLVKAGDTVAKRDPLVTLESDKATMEVLPAGGVVKDVKVKVGDKVAEGTLILTLQAAAAGATQAPRSPRGRRLPGLHHHPQPRRVLCRWHCRAGSDCSRAGNGGGR
jgi:pyruvate/2-oxoglutarate dehydrogenase complex dihydrolipoamide acyltransferase (E2) component